MNTSITSRLASLFSAALLTFAMLAGVDMLALTDAPADQIARVNASAPG
jgi:hypothetical protein